MNQSINQGDMGTVKKRFAPVDDWGVPWHEHMTFDPRAGGIRRGSPTRVPSCRQSHFGHAKFLGHADGNSHPTTFEAPGGKDRFVLDKHLLEPEFFSQSGTGQKGTGRLAQANRFAGFGQRE